MGFGMAMTKCLECFRDISDKAAACPGCGAPVVAGAEAPIAPDEASFDGEHFSGTSSLLINVARSAVSQLGFRVDAVDPAAGTVTFTTGMTMGSWSGVSGTIHLIEVAPFRFKVTGEAKQNVKGGQVIALDLFSEAQGKVEGVIRRMKDIVAGREIGEESFIDPSDADSSTLMFLLVGLALMLVVWGAFTAGG